MKNIFVQIPDPHVGADFVAIDEWIAQKFAAALAALMDERGIAQDDPLRVRATGQITAVASECVEVVRQAIAEGKSLTAISQVLGITLVRAPEYELPRGPVDYYEWVRVVAARVMQAMTRHCDELGMRRNDPARINALEMAGAELVKVLNERGRYPEASA
jgi:translation initiation factor 2 alpha subunit (eIF-2alpha)